ncbi:hypothetical protein LIER_36875 [Lithospermum erythrorhizon]|uniref:Uncharacterized protein n=1 Tax=Lithospermum erythrorhizon TaxID=34254 RepID=A0AAV3PD50_LITER
MEKPFLVSVKEMGLPTFETSDLEKGGKSCRIVNCVLALKSYKEAGGSVFAKVGENQEGSSSSKQFARKLLIVLFQEVHHYPEKCLLVVRIVKLPKRSLLSLFWRVSTWPRNGHLGTRRISI